MQYEALVEEINNFVNQSQLNSVEELGIDQIFDPPLVGVASADDPLFDRLKDPLAVSENYILPGEWLNRARSVIAYFLPFSEQIRRANRGKGFPAKEWLYGRIEGQQFNEALASHIAVMFNQEKKGSAVVPAADSRFKVSEGFISNWSERHTAYIAGLGTFSLSRSLITALGCAGRYGSVITGFNYEPTERAYTEIYQYCNFCGECQARCPAGAIKAAGSEKKAGMEKHKCRDYLQSKIKPRFAPRYGCGKCQTAVACEFKIP